MPGIHRAAALGVVAAMLLLAAAGARAAVDIGGVVEPAPTADTIDLGDLELVVVFVPGTTAIRFAAPSLELRAFTEPTDPRTFSGRGFLTRVRATFDGELVRSINSDLTCPPGVCTNEGEGIRFLFDQPVSEFVVYFEGTGAGTERLRRLESFDEDGALLDSVTVDLARFDLRAVLPVVFRADRRALARVEISDANESDTDVVRIFDAVSVTPFADETDNHRVPLPGAALGLLALLVGAMALRRRGSW